MGPKSAETHRFFEELETTGSKRYSPHEILKNNTNKAYISKQIETLFASDKKYGKVLDVGCGTAFYYPLISKKAAKIYGVDFSGNMLSCARKFCSKTGIRNAKFYLGHAERLPFKNNEFDLVFCFDFLHHAADPDRAIKEMFRVAKPGGVVGAIETNPLNPVMFLFNMLYSRTERGILKTFPFMIRKKFARYASGKAVVKYSRYVFPLFSITPDLGGVGTGLLDAAENVIGRLPIVNKFSAYYVIYAKKGRADKGRY